MFTVKEVHNDFFEADNRLLKECEDLINNPKIDLALKSERISKLGFGSAKPVKEAIDIAQKSVTAKGLIGTINYFKQHYPNNKFITEPEVKKLCEKYNLVLGDASDFTGDIPEKNIVDIEGFVLKEDDYMPALTSSLWESLMGINSAMYRARNRQMFWFENMEQSYLHGYDAIEKTEIEKPIKKDELEQPKFKVVAPREDFNTVMGVVIDGYVLKDPIVLQPVKDGYLIVTAWGDEASDEIVVNEKMN